MRALIHSGSCALAKDMEQSILGTKEEGLTSIPACGLKNLLISSTHVLVGFSNTTAVMSTTYACFHFGWSIEMFRAINMPSIMP